MQYKPLELREFHGGITDNFIDAPQHRYQEADNFLVTVNKKLYSRPGSQIYNDTEPQLPAGAVRIGAYVSHYQFLLTNYSTNLYYIDNASAYQELQGPTGNSVLTTADANSRVDSADWNRHTFVLNDDFSPVMKIYIDENDDLQVRSAGLPKLDTPPVVTKGGVDTNSYIYAFVYFYEYKVKAPIGTGHKTHNDFSAVTQVQISDSTTPDVNTVAITAIPVISNGAANNWDTSAIKVRIYRTQANGTTFTYVGEVTNGTTIYNDSASDASIVNNASLYTTGGQLSNDPTPICKCMHITDTLGLYGHIKTSSGEILSNRVRQSVADDPDSCPESMFVDVDDEIIAISSVGQTPVVLCKNSIYRLDGAFTATGDGLLEAQEIESTVGCISMTSVVQVQRGVVFAGRTGFYFTDGWEVRKLSNNFNERYAQFTITDEQKERIYATFDFNDKRVYWAVQEDGETDVNKCYVLDTRYGLGVANNDLEQIQACFTTISNPTYFVPTALIFFGGNLLRGDTRGYTFEHQSDYTSDPMIDTTKTPANWDTVYIPWDFKTAAMSFGSTLKRKFIPRMTFSAENDTNVTIQLTSINDVGKQSKPVKAVRFRKNWVWGDPSKIWGTDTEIWDFKGIIEEERRFHSDSLRCSYKQVQMNNAYDVILNSDDLSNATIDNILKTVTLDNIADYDWPSDSIGHFISFANDNYDREFEIVERTADTITIEDPTSLAPSGSTQWTIRGYSKSEVLNLVALSLWYSYLGDQVDFRAANAGSTP